MKVCNLNLTCFDVESCTESLVISPRVGCRSSSSSSSSEEPTGRPQQLPVEEAPAEEVDLAGTTSESEEGKEKVYQEALRAPFLAWRVGELQKVAPGVDLPESLCTELPQKKWEQEARRVLQQVEPEPDYNVKLLTEQKWRLTARARDQDHQHVKVTIHQNVNWNTTKLFFSRTG